MTDQVTGADSATPDREPLALRLNDLLGQASVAPGPTGYSIEAVKVCVEGAYKAGQAAERERCAKVCDELQAEMTDQGTASPYGDAFARRIREA